MNVFSSAQVERPSNFYYTTKEMLKFCLHLKFYAQRLPLQSIQRSVQNAYF